MQESSIEQFVALREHGPADDAEVRRRVLHQPITGPTAQGSTVTIESNVERFAHGFRPYDSRTLAIWTRHPRSDRCNRRIADIKRMTGDGPAFAFGTRQERITGRIVHGAFLRGERTVCFGEFDLYHHCMLARTPGGSIFAQVRKKHGFTPASPAMRVAMSHSAPGARAVLPEYGWWLAPRSWVGNPVGSVNRLPRYLIDP